MGPPIRLRTRLWLGGLAAGGVAVAHVLAFLVVAPDPLERERLLEATGHGAWPLMVTLAMGALVIALAGVTIATGRAPIPRPPAGRWRAAARRLVFLQVVGFLVLEALERLAMGQGTAGLASLPAEPVIAIGVVSQVLVALAGSILLVVLVRAAEHLAHLLPRLPRESGVLAVTGPTPAVWPRGRIVTDPVNPRGPPRRSEAR